MPWGRWGIAGSLLTIITGPLVAQATSGTVPDWENPAVVGRNKEPAHAWYVPFPDIATALASA